MLLTQTELAALLRQNSINVVTTPGRVRSFEVLDSDGTIHWSKLERGEFPPIPTVCSTELRCLMCVVGRANCAYKVESLWETLEVVDRWLTMIACA